MNGSQDAGNVDWDVIVGKTIESVPVQSDSWVEIRFTDGTGVWLTGDAGGYQQVEFLEVSISGRKK